MFFTMHTAGDLGERGVAASMGHRPERWPPPGAPPKAVSNPAGVVLNEAQPAAVTDLSAAAAGVQQGQADPAGVSNLVADPAGIVQTSAKQGEA